MEEGNNRLQYLAAFSATLVYFTSGTFVGWTSPVLPHLSSVDTLQPLTADQESWIVSLMHVGHILLAIPAGYMVDSVGRKWTLAFTATPFLASWLLIALAEDDSIRPDGQQFTYVRLNLLYAARLVAGLGVGVGSTVAALYLGEIAQDRIRGAIGTLFQIMINLGIMFEYSVAPNVSYSTLTMLSAIFPLLFMVTFVYMPESPYYLLMHQEHEKTQQVLLRLRGFKDLTSVETELNTIKLTVETSKKRTGSFKDLLTTKCNCKAMLICMGLFTTTACSGHVAILSYSTEIFKQSHSSLDPSTSVIILGGVQILLSIIPSLLVDTIGRRPLLIISSAGCALSLAAEGFFFYLTSKDNANELGWLPLIALVFFLIFYTFGLGSVPVAFMAEIFPTNVKGLASSILSVYLAVLNFTVTKLVKVVQFDYYVLFFTFSACCLLGMLFVLFMVPETKGKSLLEIYLDLKYETNGTSDQLATLMDSPHVKSLNSKGYSENS